jgi:hypothetical protein
VAFFLLQKSVSFLGEKLPNLRQSKKIGNSWLLPKNFLFTYKAKLSQKTKLKMKWKHEIKKKSQKY